MHCVGVGVRFEVRVRVEVRVKVRVRATVRVRVRSPPGLCIAPTTCYEQCCGTPTPLAMVTVGASVDFKAPEDCS